MMCCSFCFQCIQHWAQIESRCPFCKARFTTISRKELQVDKSPGDQQTDDIVRQRYPGTVVKTVQIPERNQVSCSMQQSCLKQNCMRICTCCYSFQYVLLHLRVLKIPQSTQLSMGCGIKALQWNMVQISPQGMAFAHRTLRLSRVCLLPS